jgi:hypothetical protein
MFFKQILIIKPKTGILFLTSSRFIEPKRQCHCVLDIVVIVGICVFKPKIRVGEKAEKILKNLIIFLTFLLSLLIIEQYLTFLMI